jgi:hypothetical protein
MLFCGSFTKPKIKMSQIQNAKNIEMSQIQNAKSIEMSQIWNPLVSALKEYVSIRI